jgi:hypothetical protein
VSIECECELDPPILPADNPSPPPEAHRNLSPTDTQVPITPREEGLLEDTEKKKDPIGYVATTACV